MTRFAVVDGFSSGQKLVTELRSAGHEVLSVLSKPAVPDCYRRSYDKALFDREATNDGRFDLLAEQVRGWAPDFVVAGAETGVELADQLSENLGLLTNGTGLSAARRDKFRMVEAARDAGLRTVDHFRSDRLAEILDWTRRLDQFPVVVKPVNSAGADCVAICHDEIEVAAAFHRIVGHTNQLGFRNEMAIVQTFLVGTEYIVNTVSRDGQSLVCDIWRCHKELLPGAGFISCLEELVDRDGDVQDQLVEYAVKVLGALGIEHGPAHFEIMMTAGGPTLIEVGSRLQGATNPPSIRAALGTDQLELTIQSYVEPDRFRARAGDRYHVDQHMYHAFLISPVEGLLKDLPRLDELLRLPSFFHYDLRASVGEPIVRTTGLFSSVGQVDFVHPDAGQLAKDYEEFRTIEADGFYLV